MDDTNAKVESVRLSAMLFLIIGVAVSELAGCGAKPRPVQTEESLSLRAADDTRQMTEAMEIAWANLAERANTEAREAGDDVATVDILCMSGGGDFGAFGAGFLVGWGEVEDAEYRRPNFDAVTGVSTGALLAPFAFLGTDEACLEVEEFYRNPQKDWMQQRGGLFFLPFNTSFMKIPGLERDLRSAIDLDFIEQMAEVSTASKVLLVSATDLDLGRQKFFDLGKEAEAAVESGDPSRVQRMLLASAAIPAAFPPVDIDGVIYGDGGVTANIFVRLTPDDPRSPLRRWQSEHPGSQLRLRFWLIINNQLVHAPKTVQPKWPAILAPSLATAIRYATIAEARWLAAEARYANERYGANVEVRVIGIPNDWRPPVEGAFKQETMQSLADLGRELGADPESWEVWAAPRSPR